MSDDSVLFFRIPSHSAHRRQIQICNGHTERDTKKYLKCHYRAKTKMKCANSK